MIECPVVFSSGCLQLKDNLAKYFVGASPKQHSAELCPGLVSIFAGFFLWPLFARNAISVVPDSGNHSGSAKRSGVRLVLRKCSIKSSRRITEIGQSTNKLINVENLTPFKAGSVKRNRAKSSVHVDRQQ